MHDSERLLGIKGFPYWLACYHLLVCVVFTLYINQHGGDAKGFWEMTADQSRGSQTWMEHFGTRTFFMQWLNYPFSQILGLPFWVGNLLYSLVSLWAILKIYAVSHKVLLLHNPVPAMVYLLQGVMFLPNLHFWTAGIGKEALALTGLVLFLLAWTSSRRALFLLVLGIVISWMVRPLQGAVMLAFVPFWLLQAPYPKQLKWGIGLILLCVLLPAFLYIKNISQISELSFQGVLAFFDNHQSFLKGYASGSRVPMEEYSFFGKFLTFWLRPFLTEAVGFWQVVAAMENVVIALAFAIFLITLWMHNFPKKFWVMWMIGALMSVIYSLSLNILGIMMRMKSIYMIFIFIGAVWGINLLWNYFVIKRGT
jgi:hypothetical protein